jgi:hypothetical protein
LLKPCSNGRHLKQLHRDLYLSLIDFLVHFTKIYSFVQPSRAFTIAAVLQGYCDISLNYHFTMSGGFGQDTFVCGPGTDTIADFNTIEDIIEDPDPKNCENIRRA